MSIPTISTCPPSSWRISGSKTGQWSHTWLGHSCTCGQYQAPKGHPGLDLSAGSKLTAAPATMQDNSKSIKMSTAQLCYNQTSIHNSWCRFDWKGMEREGSFQIVVVWFNFLREPILVPHKHGGNWRRDNVYLIFRLAYLFM